MYLSLTKYVLGDKEKHFYRSIYLLKDFCLLKTKENEELYADRVLDQISIYSKTFKNVFARILLKYPIRSLYSEYHRN